MASTNPAPASPTSSPATQPARENLASDLKLNTDPREDVAMQVCRQHLVISPKTFDAAPVLEAKNGFDLKTLQGVKVIAVDIYDTVISSTGIEHGHLTNNQAKVQQAFLDTCKALAIDSGPFADMAVAQFLAGEKAQKASFQHKDQTIFPEMNAPALWHTVLGLKDEETAVKFATIFELKRSGYGLLPGAVDFLEKAHENGVTVALISNSQAYTPPIVELLLRQAGKDIGALFPDDALALYSHRVNLGDRPVMKPTQAIFDLLHANAKEIHPGLQRSEIMFIGNCSTNDGAALDAGMQFGLCAVDPGKTRRNSPMPKAHVEFNSYEKLIEAFGWNKAA